MSAVVTLRERKAREIARRRAAITRIEGELRSAARACGGRILLFGSAATGRLTERSDIDLLLDVPEASEPVLWSLIEDLAGRYDIPADIHSVRTSTPAFVERVRDAARELA